MCKAAQIELFGVTAQEDVSSCLNCHSLGEIRACLCTGWFWRAAEEQISPELFLPLWANLTGHRLEPEGARDFEGQVLLPVLCSVLCSRSHVGCRPWEPLCDQVESFRRSEPTGRVR